MKDSRELAVTYEQDIWRQGNICLSLLTPRNMTAVLEESIVARVASDSES